MSSPMIVWEFPCESRSLPGFYEIIFALAASLVERKLNLRIGLFFAYYFCGFYPIIKL